MHSVAAVIAKLRSDDPIPWRSEIADDLDRAHRAMKADTDAELDALRAQIANLQRQYDDCAAYLLGLAQPKP